MFELALQLEAGYQLSEGVNLARAAIIMSLQVEDINKTRKGFYSEICCWFQM